MTDIRPEVSNLIARAGQLASSLATTNAGTPAALRFETIARNIDRLVAALPDGPGEALPISDTLCAAWAPKAEPPVGSDEERLELILGDLRSAILGWRSEQPPPFGTTYFPIDASRSTPRGLDISYECLKCGDVIPSVEEADKPWNCRCYAISVDHSAFKTWFEEPKRARGVRVVSPSIPRGVEGGSPERAGGAATDHFSCSFIQPFVVLAAIGFALGIGWSGFARLAEGHYGLGLTFLVIALLPFGAWAVVRWIALRKAGD